MRIPGVFRIVLKWIAPAYLLVVFAAFCQQSLGGRITALGEEPAAASTLAIVLVVLLALLVITRIGEIRWRAQGLDVDGKHPPDDDVEAEPR